MDYKENILVCEVYYGLRACLKNHSRQLHVPLCVIFAPNSGYIAHYVPFIWHKSPTNCDAYLTESIFQTRSRESVGWHNFSEEQTERALANSLYTVTAFNENQAVGMGRLIGDGMYFMIADLVVHPDFQKKGIGFYEKRGFKRIPHEFCGSGMRKVIRRGTVKD